MATQRVFLAFSNARCGSTLLQTSLARLPGIATDYELLWEGSNPVSKGVPGCVPVITNDWNWKPFMGSISSTAPIVGTRVVLNGFARYSPEDASQLMAGIDPDISIIHTVRDYFDTLKSSRVRNHITWVSNELLNETAAENPSLDETNLWQALRRTGLGEVDDWKNEGRPSLEISSDFILRLFINDLVMVEIARRAERRLFLEFESFRYQLHEIADFLECACTKEECDAVSDTPVAKRLPPVPDEELPNSEALKDLCRILNDTIRGALESNISMFAAWKDGLLNLPDAHMRDL